MEEKNPEFKEVNSKNSYNSIVNHPIQCFEWGEFRKKTGVKVVREGLFKDGKIIDGFTLTIHKVPYSPYFIGYLPKGNLPKKDILEELYRIGKRENCVYIQLEPNIQSNNFFDIKKEFSFYEGTIKPSFHPLFTKYTFILNLDKSDDSMFSAMHAKTRYNIKVAQKHGVKIIEDNSDEAFNKYLKLTEETTKRQNFYAHSKKYHRLMWETFKNMNNDAGNNLSPHLFSAKYNGQTLVAWMVFVFKDTIYYPYGASTNEHRNVMASNLMMWEVIKFGKKLGLKKFDMWGALKPNPDHKDPWYGFHKFKEGYGPELIEFVGSYDLIINEKVYNLLKVADKIRWPLLRFVKKISLHA